MNIGLFGAGAMVDHEHKDEYKSYLPRKHLLSFGNQTFCLQKHSNNRIYSQECLQKKM